MHSIYKSQILCSVSRTIWKVATVLLVAVKLDEERRPDAVIAVMFCRDFRAEEGSLRALGHPEGVSLQ